MAGPTAVDYANKIQTAMTSSPNYNVILTLRDEERVLGWLDVDEKVFDLANDLATAFELTTMKDAFKTLSDRALSYRVAEFYDKDQITSRINGKTLASGDAVDGLRRSEVEGVVDALLALGLRFESLEYGLKEKLAVRPFSSDQAKAVEEFLKGIGKSSDATSEIEKALEAAGIQGSRVKTIAAQLKEEFNVVCDTVKQLIEESHEKMEVGHYTAATGSSATTAPPTHQKGGAGYKLIEKFQFTDTNNNTADWTFGVRCVNEDESDYVLPVDDEAQKWHWRLDKDEEIEVEVREADQPKTTKAPDNFAPNKDRVKDPDKDSDLQKKFVEGILEKWPTKEKKWYPLAGPSTDAVPPDSHKIPVRDKEKDGYLWTFNMAWVDVDEEMYLKTDDPKKDHLVIAQGEKVVVALAGDDDVSKENTVSERVKLPIGADEDGNQGIEELFRYGGEEKWYPKEPSTDQPAPDSHKIRVVERVEGDYKWTFPLAWVDADDKVFLKKTASRADHLAVPKGEKVVVAHGNGEGDPKETVTTELITVVGGGTDDDAIAAAAIQALLANDAEKWLPASLEDQQAAKEEAEARQRSADAGKDVSEKLTALGQAAGRMGAFVRAHLNTAGRRQRAVVPQDKIKTELEDWQSFATRVSDTSALGLDHESSLDEARGCARDGLALVTEAEDLGGTAPQLDNIASLCRDLNDALNKYVTA